MAEDKQILGIVGEIDLGDFPKSISEILEQLEHLRINVSDIGNDLGKELDKINKANIDSAEKQRQSIGVMTDSLQSMLEAAEKNAELTISYSQKLNEKRTEEIAKIEQLKEKLKEVTEERDKYANGGNQWQIADVQVRRVTKQLEEEKETLNGLDNAVQSYTERLSTLQDVFSSIQNTAQRAMSSTADSTENVGGVVNTLKERFNSFAGAIGNTFNRIKEKIRSFGKENDGLDNLTESEAQLTQSTEDATTSIGKQSQSLGNLKASGEAARNAIDELKKSQDQQSQSTGEAGEKTETFINKLKDWATGGGKFQESLKAFRQSLDMLPIPLNRATEGVVKMTKAMASMLMTPLGAALAGVVLILQSLTQWFKKSADGQKAFAQITGYLSSVLASITDITARLGRYLFHAFADNTGPMHNFATNFVNIFKNAFKFVGNLVGGFGDAMKGIFTMNWDTFKNGINKLWGSIKNGVDTGKAILLGTKDLIVGTAKMIGDGAKAIKSTDLIGSLSEINNKAKENARLQLQQIEASKAISMAKEKEAELDAKIAESREKVYTLSGKERLEELTRLKELQKEKYQDRISAYEQLYKIQKRTNELHEASIEDAAKERQLNIQLLQLKAQQAAATRMTTRLEESTKRTLVSESKKKVKSQDALNKANEKLTDVIFSSENDRIQLEKDLEAKVADARIAAMKEGHDKTLAERQRENDREIEALEKQRAQVLEAERKRQKAIHDAEQSVIVAQGGSYTQWDDKAFEKSQEAKKINEAIDELIKLTNKAQDNKQIEIEEKLINAHAAYIDRKKAIDKSYEEEVKKINDGITEAQKRGDKEREDSLKRSLTELAKERAQAQAKLTLDELKETPDYIRAFEDLKTTSNDTIEFLISKFEEAKNAAAKDLSPEELREYTNTIQQMKDELLERDPFSQLNSSFVAMKTAEEELLKAQKIVDDVRSGVLIMTDMTIDATGKLIPKFLSLAEAEERFRKATDNQTTAQANFQKALNKAMTSVGMLATGFQNLGSAIGDVAGEAIGAIGDVMNFTTSAIEGIETVSTQAARGITGAMKAIETASVILALISTAIQIFSKLANLFGESGYEKLQRQTNELNKARQAVDEYRLAVLKAQQAEENWFSTTGIDKLTDAYQRHILVTENYYNKLNEEQARYLNRRASWYEQEEWMQSPYATARENLRIQTRHSTFFRSELTENLEQWVRDNLGFELFGSDGFIDLDAAEQVLEKYGDKLVGDTKATLERLIELKEQYDEFYKEMREYLSEMYSPLVDNMTNAIWNWLQTGENVMDKFKEYSSDTFADIGKEMIKMFVNQSIFDEFSNKIQDVAASFAKGDINQEQYINAALDLFDETMATAETVIPSIQEMARRIEERYGKSGIDTSSEKAAEDKKASAVATEKITYEQADKIDGILTAMQIVQGMSMERLIEQTELQALIQADVFVVRADVGRIAAGVGQMATLQQEANSHLLQIEINTSRIPEIADEITMIRRKINEAY